MIATFGLAVVVVVGVAGLCSGGWWLGASGDSLDAEIARLRARGEPVEFADFAWSGPEPNASSPAHLEALLRMCELPPKPWPALDLSAPELRAAPEAERERVRAFVDALEPFLDGVRVLAARPECRLGPAQRATDPHGSLRAWTLQNSTAFLRLARVVAWVDGDVSRVLDLHHLQTTLASRVVIDGASGEAVAVADALAHGLTGVAAIVLGDPGVSQVDVHHAIDPALEFDADALFREALRVERAIWLEYMGRVVDGAPNEDLTIPTSLPWADRSTRAGAIAWSRAVDRVLAAPRGDHVETARRITAWGGKPNVYWAATFDQGEALHGMARIRPLYLARATTRLLAMQRLCRVALACVDHHRETGAWPESLDVLDHRVDAADRTDPFTGRPLRFDRMPDGVRISSFGCTEPEVWGTRFVAANDPEADGLVWTLRR